MHVKMNSLGMSASRGVGGNVFGEMSESGFVFQRIYWQRRFLEIDLEFVPHSQLPHTAHAANDPETQSNLVKMTSLTREQHSNDWISCWAQLVDGGVEISKGWGVPKGEGMERFGFCLNKKKTQKFQKNIK